MTDSQIDDAAPARKWQTMENAPKDGTRILAVCAHGVQIVHWHTWGTAPLDPCWKSERPGVPLNAEPTHWMPLPEFPTTVTA